MHRDCPFISAIVWNWWTGPAGRSGRTNAASFGAGYQEDDYTTDRRMFRRYCGDWGGNGPLDRDGAAVPTAFLRFRGAGGGARAWCCCSRTGESPTRPSNLCGDRPPVTFGPCCWRASTIRLPLCARSARPICGSSPLLVPSLGLAPIPGACAKIRFRRIFVTDGMSVRGILEHVGEPADPPRIAPARPCATQSCFACVPAQALHGLGVRCSIAAHPPAWEEAEPFPLFDPLTQPEPEFQFDQTVSW